MPRKSQDIDSIYRRLLIICVFLCETQVRTVYSAVSTCGGTLIGRTGTFTSPNYPFPPKKEPNAAPVRTSLSSDDEGVVTCEWKIIVPEGLGIQLNFGDFDMAAGLDECIKGELEVFLGVGSEKKSLDKYCGGDELDTVQVTKNSATVIFRHPPDFKGKGFLVSYIATTPGETIDDFITCVDRGSDHVGVGSYSVLCPGGCANISDLEVWGSTYYRDNSYQCKAAVHAGVISDRFGGRINVKRLPGQIMYIGSEANGIITSSGSMSDFKIQFLLPDTCVDKLTFRGDQLTASTYWTTDKDPDKTKWKPDKGILNEQISAWSPSNPTTTQWLEVDLREVKIIKGITTKGSTSSYYTTKSYKVAYRNITSEPWTYYREEGVDSDKVFIGNTNIFQESKNNFIKPRIVARFFRVYPTPVESENERYSLQIGLFGCSANVPTPTAQTTTTTPTTTTPSTTPSTTTPSTIEYVAPSAATTRVPPSEVIMPEIESVANEVNTTRRTATTNETVAVVPPIGLPDEEGNEPTVVESDDSSDLSENSIIVIAIVAALAVTSILLAALVLILVRTRKKVPKTDIVNTPLPTPHAINNNNTQFRYENKKSKKRGKKRAMGEHFQNRNYNMSATLPQSSMIAPTFPQSNTMPLEEKRLIGNGHHNGNSQYMSHDTDSFSDDDDHEYQVIPDEMVVSDGATPAHSIRAGSSKASTGSSMGNHSRKSDTMGRTWGNAGDAYKASFNPSSPMFSVNSQRNPSSQFSSFSPGNHSTSTFSYPQNPPNHPQNARAGTFPNKVHYSVSNDQISEGVPLPPNHPNLRRGNSQSPSGFQRHSSSSNNSSHSHPIGGAPMYPHDPTNPYYSSVPNGESNTVTSLNHQSYLLYGDPTIPEQNEPVGGEVRRKPSYNVPRQFTGADEPPVLPAKKDQGVHGLHHTGSESAISRDYNGGPTRLPSHSQSMRSDYDRLIRDNSISGPADGNSKNTFSLLNGSHSQYHQLNLNAAPV